MCLFKRARLLAHVVVWDITITSPELFPFVWKSRPDKHSAVRSSARASLLLPGCWCIANIYLQSQAGGSPKRHSGREVCLYMWLSLWPLNPGRAICNTNKRRHPAGFCGASWSHFSRVKRVGLDSPQCTFPLWRSHVSHWEQFTSIETYFRKPLIQTRDERGFLSFPPRVPYSKLSILKWFPIAGFFWALFFSQIPLQASKKVYWGLFLLFIITNSLRKHNMWDAAAATRGGMFVLQSRLGLHIYSHLLKTSPLLKRGWISLAAPSSHLFVQLNLTTPNHPRVGQIW